MKTLLAATTALLSLVITTASIADIKQSTRLISSDAFVTEMIFALGADSQLVAVDVTSKLPADYRKLANIGYHRNLSAEGMLSLNPTQVIGSEHMGPANVVSALHKADVSVTQLPSALTPTQLRENIKLLANVLSKPSAGDYLLDKIDTQLHQLTKHPLTGQRIAFILGMDPRKPRLAGAQTSGAALIHILGGTNVANFNNYRNVSAESLLALQPDVIIVAGNNAQNSAYELLNANPVLEHTPAGSNKQILAVNGSAFIAGLSIAALDEAISLKQQILVSKF